VTLLPELLEQQCIGEGQFEYDHCFSWTDDNSKVYEAFARKVVLSALDGYNASIFAYGQTGSGKTYTMLGKSDDLADTAEGSSGTPRTKKHTLVRADSNRRKLASVTPFRSRSSCSTPRSKPMKQGASVIRPFRSVHKGLVMLALEDIFERVGGESDRHYFLTCSYLEIYNEHVYDLLADPNELKASQLTVVEGPDKDFTVRGLTEKVVTSLSDAMGLIRLGEESRHYAATCLNHHSSRAHTIFKLSIRSLQVITKGSEDESFENITMESVINFVDLAGSERLNPVQPEDRTLLPKTFNLSVRSDNDKGAEGKAINTSLYYLCQVVNRLSELRVGAHKNDAHIPFRNSNLTKILKSSLGGNSKTCIVFTASPSAGALEPTLNTLRFASKARGVVNQVTPNVRRETSTQLLLAYENDIAALKQMLEQAHAKNVSMSKDNAAIKAKLEVKVQSMTKQLLEVPCVFVQQNTNTPGQVWVSGVGDLLGVRQCGEKSSKVPKFDEEGVFALKRLKQMKGERDELRKTVKDLSSSVSCLKASKNSVRTM
jgi:hypothetical protein